MFTKRRIKRNNILFYLLFLLTAFANAQVDSVWSANGDTLTLVKKPIIQKEQVVIVVPKKRKEKKYIFPDNHLFISLMYNNQVDKQHYYDIQPKAQAYIKKVRANTKDGYFYGMYGVGVGYHTNRWILSGAAVMYCFQENSYDIVEQKYRGQKNGYFYAGARITPGYRIGQNKWMVFPKVEFGLNIIDRVEGKVISAYDTTQMDGAEKGYEFRFKFTRKVWSIGPAVQVCYRIKDYAFYLEPYFSQDLNNVIKPDQPFKMKRNYWGCRVALMFYFF